MTAIEAASALMNTAAGQVEGALKDWPADQWDARLNEHTMSAREQVIHLTECCLAFQKSLTGEEHSWGTYAPEDTSVDSILAAWREERAKCAAAIPTANDEQLKHAFDYIVLHDAYHVGQLVSLHLTLVPDWNSYAIYG